MNKWDGNPRRKTDFEDGGRVKDAVILARIDERINTLIEKGVNFNKEFSDHKIDDEKKFASLHKLVYIGCGIIGTLQFLILVKH